MVSLHTNVKSSYKITLEDWFISLNAKKNGSMHLTKLNYHHITFHIEKTHIKSTNLVKLANKMLKKEEKINVALMTGSLTRYDDLCNLHGFPIKYLD